MIKGCNIWSQPCIWRPHIHPGTTRATSGEFPLRLGLGLPNSPLGVRNLVSGHHSSWNGEQQGAHRAEASWPAAVCGRPAVQARPISGRGAGREAAPRAERSAKQRRHCRPGIDHDSLTRALPAAASPAATGPGPRAPQRWRPTHGVRSLPARALSGAHSLPCAQNSCARRVRLLRELPGRRGRELRGSGWRALWPRAGVRQPHRWGGARGHWALRMRAARRCLRFRRPLLPQHLRAAPARLARAQRSPWSLAQGARRPLRIW